ncbi:MAG: antirestriction protein ArdC [Xanthobacteraceae bacterium]|nr:MAG: antirestriction protein ArdC [Xanthobacteraceae bacterium]
MNAAFCCASLGIVPTVRHADYIAAWLEVLHDDNRAVVRATCSSKQSGRLHSQLPPRGRTPIASTRPHRQAGGGLMTTRFHSEHLLENAAGFLADAPAPILG